MLCCLQTKKRTSSALARLSGRKACVLEPMSYLKARQMESGMEEKMRWG